MRIEPKVVGMVGRDSGEPKEAGARTHAAEAGASVVKLSAAGSAASARSEERMDAARIAEIRAAIRSGAYRIELDTLAAKIVDDESGRVR